MSNFAQSVSGRKPGLHPTDRNNRFFGGVFITAGALVILLAGLNLWFGNLNQDEGWYLYAARQVAAGEKPFLDFAFTQGPVLPAVYAFFYPVVERLGLTGGRLLTAGCGLLAALLLAWTAARAAPRAKNTVALTVLLLTAGNAMHSYFNVIVKTYALCSLFIAAACLLLTFRAGTREWPCLFSGLLLALAAATRLSSGILLPVTALFLLFTPRPGKPTRSTTLNLPALLWFGFGGGLTLLLCFGPFLLQAPESVWFGLFEYHAARHPGGLLRQLLLKAGFISRFVQHYFLFILLTLAALFTRQRKMAPATGFASLLWIGGLALSLVHFLAPFPYDDYQTIALPLLAAALALTLPPRLSPEWHRPFVGFLLLAAVAGAFSAPLNQEWFVRGRDRIWWEFKEQPDLVQLKNAAEQVRARTAPGELLLTQDLYLAVEANRSVPRGLEMGPFSYAPSFSRERAKTLHLLNREQMVELLTRQDIPLAAFSGYGLSIAAPEIEKLTPEEARELRSALETHWRKTLEIPHVGQAHTHLEFFEPIR